MKKILIISLLTMVIAMLTACATAPSSSQPDFAPPGGASSGSLPINPAAPTTDSVPPTNSSPNDDSSTISDETRLVIGTFKLEGTDQAVTPDQAAALLPLWKVMKEIEDKSVPQGNQPQDNQQSNTTPVVNFDIQPQINAQVKQIQGAMTAEQLKAIDDMQLTRQDIMAIIQEQGITMGNPQPGNGSGQGNGTMTPPQGAHSAGGTPQGFGNGGAQGLRPGPHPMGTPQPGGRQGGGGGLPPGVIDALIQFLQKKAGS